MKELCPYRVGVANPETPKNSISSSTLLPKGQGLDRVESSNLGKMDF